MTRPPVISAHPPTQSGLYRPESEHDACGVGMICQIDNTKSHALIEDALNILVNLTHRGACGCDETTGDGAASSFRNPTPSCARWQEQQRRRERWWRASATMAANI